MIISDKLKIIFFHIPKNAGTFIWKLLYNIDSNILIKKTNYKYLGENYQTHHCLPSDNINTIKEYVNLGYFIFVIFRNPLDSLISNFNYTKNNIYHPLNKTVKNMSFYDFVNYQCSEEPDYLYQNYVSQKKFLYNGEDIINEINIILFDDFIYVLKDILNERNIDIDKYNLTPINVSSKVNKDDYYNDEILNILKNNKKFQDDIEIYEKLKIQKRKN
jgi:hypothetical protein